MGPSVGSLLTFVIIPLLGPGLVRKIRARAQGREGPPLLQPWYDILRQLQKKPIDGPHSGFFAEFSPISLASLGLILWYTVCLNRLSLLLIPFLLAAMSFLLSAFAMETGTSFGGLGASRETLLASLAKPAILVLIVLLDGIIVPPQGWRGVLIGVIMSSSLFLAILAETAKPPFDDPRTHLELTMVHEAMILEASGQKLALIEFGSVLKEAALFTLASQIFLHWLFLPLFGLVQQPWLLTLLLTLGTFIFLGFWESISVRRKWSWISETLGACFLILVFMITFIHFEVI